MHRRGGTRHQPRRHLGPYIAALMAPGGHLVCVEANPRLLPGLRERLARRTASLRVDFIHSAVTGHCGAAVLDLSPRRCPAARRRGRSAGAHAARDPAANRGGRFRPGSRYRGSRVRLSPAGPRCAARLPTRGHRAARHHRRWPRGVGFRSPGGCGFRRSSNRWPSRSCRQPRPAVTRHISAASRIVRANAAGPNRADRSAPPRRSLSRRARSSSSRDSCLASMAGSPDR